MPEPLIAKGSTNVSLAGQIVLIIFIGLPVAGLWYCYHHGRVIHFDNPWWNLGAHIALFIFPMIWVGLMFVKPLVYEAPKDHTVIATANFFERMKLDWWMMFMLWATPVVAVVVMGHALATKDLAHPEILSTSFGKALGIIAVVFCLGFFFGTMLSGKDSPATWISNEGFRTSVARFHEWKDIHHISRRDDVYTIFNHASPAIPGCAFEVRDPQARAILERLLAEHQVRIFDDPSPVFLAVKFGVILGFIANVAFSLWLRFYLSFSFITVILISFGMGIVLTLIFEKLRGVSKYVKSKPRVEFSDDDDIIAPKPGN